MAAQGGVVGHDDVIADDAIMGDVGADHEQAIVADTGFHAVALGARVHGDVFADLVAGADDQNRLLALIFQVLRPRSDRGKRKDRGFRPDRRPAINDHMGMELNAIAQADLRADHAIGADAHFVAQCSLRRDNRRGMNIGHSIVHDHRRVGCFGDRFVPDLCLAGKFPNRSAIAQNAHLQA